MATVKQSAVYLIDDDEGVRDILGQLLADAGYLVKPFASAQAFFDAINPDSRGCVIADVRMPGMSGIELLQLASKRGLTLPIIIVTGHADVPLAVEAIKLGAVDLLEKPVKPEELVSAVASALAGRESESDKRAPFAAALSDREAEVLRGVLDGRTSREIAIDLGIRPRTVETHRSNIMRKVGAKNHSELVALALTGKRLDAGPP